jgi:hypothetical protein
MGSTRTRESIDSDPELGLLEADLEEAMSILGLHTVRAQAAIASQAAARAEVVSRLQAAVHGSVIFLAYALVTTRRWIHREHEQHRRHWGCYQSSSAAYTAAGGYEGGALGRPATTR